MLTQTNVYFPGAKLCKKKQTKKNFSLTNMVIYATSLKCLKQMILYYSDYAIMY